MTTTWNDIEIMAQLSHAAYERDTPLEDLLPAGWKNITGELHYSDGRETDGYFDNVNAQGYVATNSDTLAIVFRGSENLADFRSSVHQHQYYTRLEPMISAAEAYAYEHGFSNVYVTGHSLGGAAAEQFSIREQSFKEKSIDINVEIASFGSPGIMDTIATGEPTVTFSSSGDGSIGGVNLLGQTTSSPTAGQITIPVQDLSLNLLWPVLRIVHVGDPIPHHFLGLGWQYIGDEIDLSLPAVSDDGFYQHDALRYWKSVELIKEADVPIDERSITVYYDTVHSVSLLEAFHGVLVGSEESDDMYVQPPDAPGGLTAISVSFFGGNGNDTLIGRNGRDLLVGGQGNDNIYGGAGHDSLDGGDGNDTFEGGPGDDRIFGGPGNDLIDGGGIHNTLGEWYTVCGLSL